jgi:uroporphyrinogen decarboxylase
MNHKQRVEAALRREATDRVPVWMWYHPATSQMMSVALEIPSSFLDEVLGHDIKQTWVSNNYAMEGIVHEKEGDSHIDEWGITWVRIGEFNQIKSYPLKESSRKEIFGYQYPYHKSDHLLKLMEPVLKYKKEYFIGCDISPSLFEMIWRLRGMENSIFDIASDRELFKTMIDQAADFNLHLAKRACGEFDLDWLWTGDDVAGKENLIMSPEDWRELLKPRLKEIFEVGKSKGLWIAHHCCGALRSIIPDLIEIGLDVLNPIQCDCRGMNPSDLKKDFGNELAFMGGVDTIELLPNASANQVYKETIKLIEMMTRDGGGYILAASHTIPPETPLENIFALYEAAGISKEQILDKAAEVRMNLN